MTIGRPRRTSPRRTFRTLGLLVASLAGACGKPAETPPAADRSASPSVAPAPAPAADGRPAGEVPADARAPRDPDPPPKKSAAPQETPAGAPGAQPAGPATESPKPAASDPGAAPPSPAPVPAAATPPRPEPSAEVRAARDAARAKIAAGNASEAVGDLKAAEAQLGPTADLRLEAGRAFLALAESALSRGDDGFMIKGLVADAHLRWKQATALDPRVPGAAVLRARIYRFEENPAAAKATLAESLAASPDDAAAHALLGEMATAAREWEEADLHWTKAAVLDPKDGVARFQATLAKQWLRVPAAQLEEGYLTAARLLPNDAEPVRLLMAIQPEDRTKRLAVLQKVIDGSAGAVWARIWMAHVVRTEGTPDPKRAIEILKEAERAAPTQPAVHFNLGLAREETGEQGEAVRSYLACVENSREGQCAQASDALDRLLHDPASGAGKDLPLSLRYRCYDAVLAKNPAEGRYGNNAGLWCRDVGRDYERSLRCYLAAVRAAPDDQDYLNDCALIWLFHLTEKKDESLPMFEKVVALVEEEGQEPQRGYWDALENLCKYWFEQGAWEKVVAFAKKRADPKAAVGGRPYPSLRAAAYGGQAQKKLDEAKKR
jgi:tetratricopeptide (TPR) repeat protein